MMMGRMTRTLEHVATQTLRLRGRLVGLRGVVCSTMRCGDGVCGLIGAIAALELGRSMRTWHTSQLSRPPGDAFRAFTPEERRNYFA